MIDIERVQGRLARTRYPDMSLDDSGDRTGDERVIYDIRGDRFDVEIGYQGVQARAFGQSREVVYVDDLAFSLNPVPLAESSQRLVVDESL